MVLIEARYWRIEIQTCAAGCHCVVSVMPIAYVGKEEFKTRVAAFKRFFMDFTRKWCWVRAFSNQADAQDFAKGLARYLGEIAYLNRGSLCLATPREAENEKLGEAS